MAKKHYIVFRRRARFLRLGVGLSYAYKTGGPVLKEDAKFRNINGFWLNTRKSNRWFLFRRVG